MNAAQRPPFRLGVEPANKGRKFPAEPLTRDEIARLMRACGRGIIGERNRALIAVAYRTGLRDMEVRGLEVRDVDLVDGVLRVREGKGRKARVLGIDDELIASLRRWLELRERAGAPPRSGPIFITLTRGSFGRELSESAMRNALPKIGRRAGIEKRVHMHGLRHTFADQALREGAPLTLVQAMLGHGSLKTTERYVSHLRPGEVINHMRGRQWDDSQARAGAELGHVLAAAGPDVVAGLRAALAQLDVAA